MRFEANLTCLISWFHQLRVGRWSELSWSHVTITRQSSSLSTNQGCVGAGIPPSRCPWRPRSCQSSCCHGTLFALNSATFVARVTPASLEPYQSHHNGPLRSHCDVWSSALLLSQWWNTHRKHRAQEKLTLSLLWLFRRFSVLLLQGWGFH